MGDLRETHPGKRIPVAFQPGFYKRLGFEVLARVETAPDAALHVMGLTLSGQGPR